MKHQTKVLVGLIGKEVESKLLSTGIITEEARTKACQAIFDAVLEVIERHKGYEL